jgi:hypothetical protein
MEAPRIHGEHDAVKLEVSGESEHPIIHLMGV